VTSSVSANGRKRCADRRFPRSPPTVDAEVMRSLGDSFFRRPVPTVSATASVAPSMQVRGWGLGPRLGRGPVRGRAGMRRRGPRRRPARCLGDNCQSSAQTAPVGSRQLKLGRHSVACGLVGCSRAWWNDRENDHQSKRRPPVRCVWASSRSGRHPDHRARSRCADPKLHGQADPWLATTSGWKLTVS
jgi:hypothetical protein